VKKSARYINMQQRDGETPENGIFYENNELQKAAANYCATSDKNTSGLPASHRHTGSSFHQYSQ